MQDVFIQFAIIVLIVLVVSFVMRLLRQPLIIGYIISGILLGPIMFDLLPKGDTLQLFSHISLTFLLFIFGLHLSPRVFKEVGKISIIVGIGQAVFTIALSYLVARLLDFPFFTALYIATAISFSSTIIIMKLIADKDAHEKLYGKFAIGFLLVQDCIAIAIHLFIISFSHAPTPLMTTLFSMSVLKGVGLILFAIPIAIFVLPKLTAFFARSQEFLFLFALGWGVGFASLFLYAGFSLEVGALIAGIVLSLTPYNVEISSKFRPIRDLFVVAFFMLLGSYIVFTDVQALLIPIIVFSLIILIGNPLIVMILMGLTGYTKNTSFMCGLLVAQISEFSLIIIALGVKLGHIPQNITTLIALVGLITIAGSTYLTLFGEKIYARIAPLLSIFERKNAKIHTIKSAAFPYILLGENRIGFSIMKSFNHVKKKFLVVDYDPQVIKRLSKEGVDCVYGDVSNRDLLEQLPLKNARLIVSTIPDRETNLLIIDVVKKRNKSIILILAARQISDAFELYRAGADYVILPHFLGGEYTAKLIEHAHDSKEVYKKEKTKQLHELQQRIRRGHEHPSIEKDFKSSFFRIK